MSRLSKKDSRPRLENLDAMFGLEATEIQTTGKNTIVSIEIKKLIPFQNHPFHLYEGERLEDMTASIIANGILAPIIVRKINDTLEILAGHNRVNAAKLAGLSEIPAVILENISDEDAMVYVIETNLLQRSFSDMKHSEKAAVIAMHHSKMFSQGKRNDILEQIKILEKTHESEENETSSQVAKKLTTIEKVGETYHLSKDTVARYLRIGQLIPELKVKLDNKNFAFIPAVTISFLKETEQVLLYDCMNRNNLTFDMKKANVLRRLSEEDKLNYESIYQILSGKIIPKVNRIPTVKLSNDVYSKYFKPDQTAREIQGVVEKALEMYFEHHKEGLISTS